MKHVAWTKGERASLRLRYPNEPTANIARDLGRSVNSVYGKAYSMGLAKSAEYLAGPQAHRLDGKIGAAHRFPRGNTPWNKGTKFCAGGRSAETRFKKGNRPHTWAPIGTERVTTKDQFLVRKVTDTGCQRVDWVPVHRLLWIEHHGPIPKNHVIAFRDGDKRNIVIENLECLTRRENMLRNTIHHYPKELADTMRLKGTVTRAINQRIRDEKQDAGFAESSV